MDVGLNGWTGLRLDMCPGQQFDDIPILGDGHQEIK